MEPDSPSAPGAPSAPNAYIDMAAALEEVGANEDISVQSHSKEENEKPTPQ
jgi:hypothetical protein